MNTLKKATENNETSKPSLTLVSTPTKTGIECLAEIRAKLNSKSRNPAHIFDKVLLTEQRKAVCFIAGLKRNDLEKRFNDFTLEQRLNIKNAILLCGSIFHTFNNAQALEKSKFTQGQQ